MPHDQRDLNVKDTYAGREPRDGLEDEIVARLRGAGHLGGSRTRPSSWRRHVVRLAAGVVLFAAGWGSAVAVSARGTGSMTEAPAQTMLLLWEGPEFGFDPRAASEYASWGESVANKGIQVAGEELAPGGEFLGPSPSDGDPGGQGPSNEYRVGGYFVLGTDVSGAMTLAETHPHRRSGGWIQVVPVVVR